MGQYGPTLLNTIGQGRARLAPKTNDGQARREPDCRNLDRGIYLRTRLIKRTLGRERALEICDQHADASA
jgi:hypothetical protein